MKFIVRAQLQVGSKTALFLEGEHTESMNNMPFTTDQGIKGTIQSVGIGGMVQRGAIHVLTDLPFGDMPKFIQTEGVN